MSLNDHLAAIHSDWPTRRCHRGFGLPEMMLAMMFGSVMVLSAVKVYPQLRQRLAVVYQHHSLELSMQRVISSIEKDLRRAGFCNGQCQGTRFYLSQYKGEKADSCVIVAYDLNRNGHWEGIKHQKSEYFGYRLRKNQLEAARGERDCQSRGWEGLFETQKISITDFGIQREKPSLNSTLLTLRLFGHIKQAPEIEQRLQHTVNGYNL
ncbi:putative prepilin peptidase-dependent protein B [Yersinia ruckeri]|uniref:prepilin peptidase-dependent protein n=1 Tax=Yersinia ruckeri TaxID=29486 RepID=UPI0005AC9FD9|nr:prepilin peptidase-dependent protein [Yersinia ruckeri]AJI95207.1 putative prepilin peptidase-dependent protein B [Yersinia ruckeri]MCW6567386.1 prepilin peptidase-dependent protein [Yersinia ruckeri]